MSRTVKVTVKNCYWNKQFVHEIELIVKEGGIYHRNDEKLWKKHSWRVVGKVKTYKSCDLLRLFLFSFYYNYDYYSVIY